MKISNSETNSYLKCRRKHFYSFRLKLQPKRHSDSLSRGILGHEALAAFYQYVADHQPYDIDDKTMVYQAGKLTMLQVLGTYGMTHMDELDLVNKLTDLLNRYVDFAIKEDNFDILEVEAEHHWAPPGTDIDFPMRLDLLIKYTSGSRKGEVALLDHKFVYDFWSEDDLRMNAQMPKYMGTLWAEGLPVKYAVLNQIRHRTNKGYMEDHEKFRRDYLPYEKREVQNVMREQILVSDEIDALNQLSVDEHDSRAYRTLDRFSCKNCSFVNLCKTDLIGEDTTLMKVVDFQKSDYGYDAEDKVETSG